MHPRDKIIRSLPDLSHLCKLKKIIGQTIVLTCGCFDFLRGEHLEHVWRAASRGWLVVGICSDAGVKAFKGIGWPIRGEDDRAFTMAGFSQVNLVFVYGNEYELIEAVEPEVYVPWVANSIPTMDQNCSKTLAKLGVLIVEPDPKEKNVAEFVSASA